MKRRTTFILVAAALALLAAPTGRTGPTFKVDDDKAQCPDAQFTSIQAAVAAAPAGAKILVCAGTYHERVAVTKNNLTIKRKGKPGSVIVDGDNLMTPVPAAFQLQNVSGVRIEGFMIRRGHEADILLINADRNRIRKNVVTLAGHDGIELLQGSAHNVIDHNVSIDNLAGNACGIQIRDAGSDSNVVRHNRAINNNWGIRIGFGAIANVVAHNQALRNRAFGILNGFTAGVARPANGTVIRNNRVFNNVGPGIAVQVSTGVVVKNNRAFRNNPDLFWDGFGANAFANNHCATSVPPGLCRHTKPKKH
jgi:parallel beta-helix repeat protein